MKTAEEIVNNCPSVKIGVDDFYGKQTFIKAIEQAQKDAYNQALDDVAKYSIDRNPDGVVIHDGIDSESILKLKK